MLGNYVYWLSYDSSSMMAINHIFDITIIWWLSCATHMSTYVDCRETSVQSQQSLEENELLR